MTNETITFGLRVERHMHYGTDTLTVSVMLKEPGASFPINGQSEPFSTFDRSAPKGWLGAAVGNMHLRAWIYDRSNHGPHLHGFEQVKVDGTSLDQRELAALLKGVKRADAGIAKAQAECRKLAAPFSLGAAVIGLARGVGATWHASPERPNFSMYSQVDWTFEPVAAAVAKAAMLEAEMIRDAIAKKAA